MVPDETRCQVVRRWTSLRTCSVRLTPTSPTFTDCRITGADKRSFGTWESGKGSSRPVAAELLRVGRTDTIMLSFELVALRCRSGCCSPLPCPPSSSDSLWPALVDVVVPWPASPILLEDDARSLWWRCWAEALLSPINGKAGDLKVSSFSPMQQHCLPFGEGHHEPSTTVSLFPRDRQAKCSKTNPSPPASASRADLGVARMQETTAVVAGNSSSCSFTRRWPATRRCSNPCPCCFSR